MIWIAAAYSAALSLLCLGAALACGCVRPWAGSAAGAIAAAALVRCARRGRHGQVLLSLGSDGRVGLLSEDPAQAPAAFWPIGVTASLICLSRADGTGDRRSIWRDAIAQDGFRRIAAYGLWRRSAASDPVYPSELIARNAVRCTRTALRPRWPRAE